jgi:hypothetical protein
VLFADGVLPAGSTGVMSLICWYVSSLESCTGMSSSNSKGPEPDAMRIISASSSASWEEEDEEEVDLRFCIGENITQLYM